jgi:hypothetical protein
VNVYTDNDYSCLIYTLLGCSSAAERCDRQHVLAPHHTNMPCFLVSGQTTHPVKDFQAHSFIPRPYTVSVSP